MPRKARKRSNITIGELSVRKRFIKYVNKVSELNAETGIMDRVLTVQTFLSLKKNPTISESKIKETSAYDEPKWLKPQTHKEEYFIFRMPEKVLRKIDAEVDSVRKELKAGIENPATIKNEKLRKFLLNEKLVKRIAETFNIKFDAEERRKSLEKS